MGETAGRSDNQTSANKAALLKATGLLCVMAERRQINELHVFRLDRNLYSPLHYPGDHGFLPQALAQDGYTLDVLILRDSPTFPGCVFQARPVGLFEMLDQGVPDEKILAHATGNPRAESIQGYLDVMPHLLRETEHFFSVYKNLEGKRTVVLGWKDRDAAYEVIRHGHERCKEKAEAH